MSTKFSIFNFQLSILFLIILLASFLRFWQLNNVPPSPSLDEVSIGYNAYSIIETGKDEYGTFPILLRAYDDWRPAMHVYTSIPFVKMLGPSAIAVRLPSAILSVLTVLATYFLVKALFKRKDIALVAAFLLASSPWHVYISRIGHEVNEGLAFFIFAMLFSLQRKVFLAAVFFALSFAAYHTEKAFVPVLLLGGAFIFRKELWTQRKKIVIATCIILLLLSPFLKESFSPEGFSRFRGANIFAGQERQISERVGFLANAAEKNDILGQILYNRRILAAEVVFRAYISHFNPSWLFANSFHEEHKVPNMGLLHAWELPFILLGLILLVTKKFDTKTKKLFFLWFLAAPVAASFALHAPHAGRSFVFLPTWQIASAIGMLFVYDFLRSKVGSRVSILIFFAPIFVSMLYLYKNYFKVFPKTESASFQYALSQAIPFVLEHEKQYDKVVFSNKDSLDQSYMFFLFFSRYDPSLYQKQRGDASGGFQQTHVIGKFEFRRFDFDKERILMPTLFVGNTADFAQQVSEGEAVLTTMSNLDGKPVIKIIDGR